MTQVAESNQVSQAAVCRAVDEIEAQGARLDSTDPEGVVRRCIEVALNHLDPGQNHGYRIPEEAITLATEALMHGPPDPIRDEFGESAVTTNPGTARKGATRALRAALPAIHRDLRERLEAMIKRQKINSRDTGWVVPVTSLEAFVEIELGADRG